MPCEDCKWAKYKIRANGGKLPIDNSCEVCWVTAGSGFPLFAWQDLVTKARNNKEFARMFESCRRLVMGDRKKDFNLQEVTTDVVTGMRLESRCLFLTEAEFEREFGISWDKSGMNLTLTELLDEEGVPIKGISIQDPSRMFRTLVTFSYTESRLRENFLSASSQLRKEQGEETYDWLRRATLDRRPQALRTSRGPPRGGRT